MQVPPSFKQPALSDVIDERSSSIFRRVSQSKLTRAFAYHEDEDGNVELEMRNPMVDLEENAGKRVLMLVLKITEITCSTTMVNQSLQASSNFCCMAAGSIMSSLLFG
jgi:hypothetical protein